MQQLVQLTASVFSLDSPAVKGSHVSIGHGASPAAIAAPGSVVRLRRTVVMRCSTRGYRNDPPSRCTAALPSGRARNLNPKKRSWSRPRAISPAKAGIKNANGRALCIRLRARNRPIVKRGSDEPPEAVAPTRCRGANNGRQMGGQETWKPPSTASSWPVT